MYYLSIVYDCGKFVELGAQSVLLLCHQVHRHIED